MAFDNHTQEQIQRYLDGDMSASEQQIFEKKIANNDALSQEIVLQKEIASLLADTPENALRKNLQTLNDQYSNPSTSGGSWKNFIWLAPLLLIGGIWFFSNSTDENAEEVSSSVPSETLSTPKEPSVAPIDVDTSNLELINPKEPKEETTPLMENPKNETKQSPKKEKEKTKTPVYADQITSPSKEPIEPPMIMAAPSLLNHDFFAPLPLLDSLIAQNFQSENFRITIKQALPDTLTLQKVQTNNYLLTAVLSLSNTLTFSPSELGLYLYPNHSFYWKEHHPWDFTSAETKEINADTYQIQLTPNFNLEPGLYYYALRPSKEGEVFFVGQLVIEE